MDEDKLVFRSNLMLQLRTLLFGALGSIFLGLMASGFLPRAAAIGIGVAFLLFMMYIALIRDDIVIGVDRNTFTMHRRGKEIHRFDREKTDFYAYIKQHNRGSNWLLTIKTYGGLIIHIDCYMLGKKQFFQLLSSLGVKVTSPGTLPD